MADQLGPADVAARLVVGVAGPWPTALEAAWLERWQPSGVILFSRNICNFNQLSRLCRKLHEIRPGLEISADHEGGPVSQLAAAVGRPPAAWALGVLGDVDLTRRVHTETGRRLRLAGVDRVLAPCADVLTEPRNPVIGARAFGAEVHAVAGQVTAAVAGLQAAGLHCCLKHWPGHGASGQDTHLTTAAAQDADSGLPFACGLAAGADAVMVGHLGDEPHGLPATLDQARLVAWRKQFNRSAAGPVLLFADDVTMGALRPAMARRGIRAADGAGEGLADPAALPLAWLSALAEAGNDRLLIRGIPWTALPLPPGATADSPEVFQTADPDPAWAVEPYGEVRRRLLDGFDPAFFEGSLELGWLDLTEGDRWEVAGGDPAHLRAAFAAALGLRFAGVCGLGQGGQAPPAAPLKRLLVTSHRPLSPAWQREAWNKLPLAPEGCCLVMGHPSLAADVSSQVGPGWSVTSWYEADWAFLAGEFSKPA